VRTASLAALWLIDAVLVSIHNETTSSSTYIADVPKLHCRLLSPLNIHGTLPYSHSHILKWLEHTKSNLM
jgi:hypothetical protein